MYKPFLSPSSSTLKFKPFNDQDKTKYLEVLILLISHILCKSLVCIVAVEESSHQSLHQNCHHL